MPNEFRDRLEHVVLLASDLKQEPAIAAALAQTPGLGDQDVTAVAGAARGRNYRNWLESLSPERRTQEWNRLGANERNLAQAAGYDALRPGANPAPMPVPAAPAAPAERGGFAGLLDDVVGGITKARDVVWEAGADVLDAAGAPLRAVQHVQRAGMVLGSEIGLGETHSALAGWSLGIKGWIEGTGDWSRAWRESEFGEKTYDQNALNNVRGTYDRVTFDLAKRIAEGEGPDSIRNSAKSPDELDMYNNMLNNPVLQDAVDALHGSKLSVGRVVARDLGIDPTNAWFTAVSGSVDFTNAMFLDPLLVGGKFAKTVNAARYGVAGPSVQRIADLFEKSSNPLTASSNVRRYWKGALPSVNALIAKQDGKAVGDAFNEISTNYKRALPMLNDIRDYAKSNGKESLEIDDIKHFFMGQHGALNLMLGQPAHRALLMPKQGVIQKYIGDSIRNGVRAGWIGALEKPSQFVANRLYGALDELEGGYKYTHVVADELVDGLDTMTAKQRMLAIKKKIPTLVNDGRTYERQNKDGSWYPVRIDKIAPSSILAGKVRIRENNMDMLEEQGRALARLRDESKTYRAAMFASRLVEKTPAGKKGRLQLDSSDAPKIIYNLARAYLPRWHANQVAGAFTASDINGKMLVYKGLLHTMGEAAGITRHLDGTIDEEGVKWLQKYVDEIDELGTPSSKRAYSAVEGNDVIREGSKDALFESQFATDVALPSFREMHDLAARKGIASALGHAVTYRHLDTFMERFWRPSVLIRPALAFRNSLEEVTLHGFAHGAGDFVKGQYARRLADKAVKQQMKQGYAGEITGPLAEIGRKVDADSLRYMDEYVEHDGHLEYMEGMRDQNVRAINNRESGVGVEEWRGERRGVKQAEIRFRNIGDYTVKDATGGDGAARWATELGMKLASSELGKAALFDIEDRARAIESMQDLILSPGFQRNQEYSRMFKTALGGATDPASKREAARVWAERAYNDIHHLLSDRSGQLNQDLINDLRVIAPSGRVVVNRQALTRERLSQVPEDLRPAHVIAPDTTLVEPNSSGWWTRQVERGYEWTGKLTGVLGKNAIYHANYLDARKGMAAWEQQLVDDYFVRIVNQKGLNLSDPEMAAQVAEARDVARNQAAATLVKQALRAAEMRTLAYVDNPDIRSQASVILRNVVPFQRAQEEFFRRWARNFRHNPESLRKMSMLWEGAEHSGAIERDEEGNAVFVYPATRQAQELMHKVGSTFGWNWAMSPVPHRFTSQVRFLNQGLDPKNVLPSFGPVAAMPMKSMEWMFPESVGLRTANRAVFGDQAANSGALGSVMPTFARRIYESGILGNDSEQLASAMKQAAVYMEAAGRTPPEGAPPNVLEDYQDDLRTWSRVHLFMRAIFGTTAPAAPGEMGTAAEAPIGPALTGPGGDPGVWMSQHRLIDEFRRKYYPTIESEFRGEVQRLSGQYGEQGYTMALANWIRTRPNELPFTVGKSEAEFGGYVPATREAGNFFDQNRELFRNFPAAAVLFMPQGKGEFDMDVYRSQLGSELRRRKDFETFARDLKLVGNLQTYYDMKEKYGAEEAAARSAGNAAGARDIASRWTAAAKVFKASHPAVGSYLDDYQARKQDRDRVMKELQDMIDSNSMPDIEGKRHITGSGRRLPHSADES